MKILMVCTHPNGGATIAARRQAQALRAAGQQCYLLSIREDMACLDIYITRKAHEITINVPSLSWNQNGHLTGVYCSKNRTDISNTWFSFWPFETFLDQALLDVCLEFNVVHFHWITQIVSSQFLAELKKHGRRIVVTSHDMNHFTGGCHYSAGCDRYKKECTDCPQLQADPLNLVVNSFYQKIAAFSQLPITWLFPSKWLSSAFGESRLQDNPAANKVLYNCIDTEKFLPLSDEKRAALRSKFGFSDHDMVFVAGSIDNTEKRKGFEYIVHAIRQLSLGLKSEKHGKRHCVVVTFGEGEPQLGIPCSFVRHLHLGSVDELTVLRLFQSSDLMIMSSIEENFANTILESLMCGCPVLAFRIGGVPDIVEHDQNGWIVGDVSYAAFSHRLSSLAHVELLAEMRRSTQRWRDKKVAQYSYSFIARELLDVYRNPEDTTMAHTIAYPDELVPTNHLYKTLFGSVTPNDTATQGLFAGNISRLISMAIGKTSPSESENTQLTIPAIFRGFSNVVKHQELGHVAWILKQANVIFKPGNGALPALCIQVPNVEWAVEDVKIAMGSLRATVNGVNAEIHYIKPVARGKYVYLWILPAPDSVITGKYNTINLAIDTASVPEELDARGLCILYYQSTVFDLQGWVKSGTGMTVPDFGTSTALALKATQSYYLWDGWTPKNNSDAALPNVVENWIDLLRGHGNLNGELS